MDASRSLMLSMSPPGEEIRTKYGGVADRVQLQFGGSDYWADVLDDLRTE